MKKNEFFEKMSALGLALTYDDVRLKSGYSEVMPGHVCIESRFSRNVPLKLPIVSAAMDTVTERKLAQSMAKCGGLGIIHRNLSIEQQAYKVTRVKSHLNAKIEHPLCLFEDQTMESVLAKKEAEELSFHTFPVISKEGKLVGLITQSDFLFCDSPSTLVRDMMTKPVLSGSPETSIDEAYDFMISNKKKMMPLTSSDGVVCGLYIYSDVQRVKTGASNHYNLDRNGQLRVGAAIGTGASSLDRAEALVEANVDVLVVDTAHGDSKAVYEVVKECKKRFSTDIVVGNVSDSESVKRLVQAGVDGIKVGQGPGSICTTRIIAGIGTPQVTAIYECSLEASKAGVPICADGGLRYSGDITIAIGAGSHSVMMGSMLAGTEEAPGQKVFFHGRQWKQYRGMGSLSAMQSNASSRERYRQEDKHTLIPEGVEGMVPFKGRLEDVLFQYAGGLRAGMGYVGAKDLHELREKARFHRISSAGKAESHVHGIQVTEETPNYSWRGPV